MSSIVVFSGGDGQHEFHADKGNPGHSTPASSQEWEFSRLKACTVASYNYGVCLEISRKLFFY
jgi:hypothetical protein